MRNVAIIRSTQRKEVIHCRQNPFETTIFSLALYLEPIELNEFPGLMRDTGVIVPSFVLNVELVDPILDVMVPVREEATEPLR
jgi:hypothetical protein